MMNLQEIEELENKYLNKYYYFLRFAEDELLKGFKTKSVIYDDWIDNYKSGISDFAVGAERIVYSLLNGKGIGQPNSAPVGSDLFFEVQDAFVHIDLKTVGASLLSGDNIGDYIRSIFVGTNQNSYTGSMVVRGKQKFRSYKASLPAFYNKGKENEKICLTYFITILYDKDTLEVLVMCIICMPNGELESHYKAKVLQAGKNLDKTRFRFSEVPNFELLHPIQKRIKVVYFNFNMDSAYQKKLEFFSKLYQSQGS